MSIYMKERESYTHKQIERNGERHRKTERERERQRETHIHILDSVLRLLFLAMLIVYNTASDNTYTHNRGNNTLHIYIHNTYTRIKAQLTKTQIHKCIHNTYTHVHIHTYIHTYTYMHTYTHTQTQKYRDSCRVATLFSNAKTHTHTLLEWNESVVNEYAILSRSDR